MHIPHQHTQTEYPTYPGVTEEPDDLELLKTDAQMAMARYFDARRRHEQEKQNERK